MHFRTECLGYIAYESGQWVHYRNGHVVADMSTEEFLEFAHSLPEKGFELIPGRQNSILWIYN